MAQVTLVGLGPVGAALGVALRRYAAAPENRSGRFTVVGYDPDHDRQQLAQNKWGSLDRSAHTLAEAVREAAFVVINLPTSEIRQALADMAPHLPQGAIVSDTAPSKSLVLRWAAELLPPGVSFVGGHPIPKRLPAAPGESPLEQDAKPDPDIYKGGIYCIMPLPTASEAAINQVISLANLLGAQPYFVDPLEHDSFMAAIMHLPALLGATLLHTTTGSAVWRELGPLAGAGFRDVTRLAADDPAAARDAFLASRDSLLHWLDRYLGDLADLRDQLIAVTDPDPAVAAAAEAELSRTLRRAATARSDWLRGVTTPTSDDQLSNSLKEAGTNRLGQSLLGGWLAGRFGGGPGGDDDKTRRR